MNLAHVVVGGGSGFIGSKLIETLALKDIRWTCISRMPGPNRISWTDVKKHGLPDDTTAVINVAGQNVLDPFQAWNKGFKQNVWNSRVETTQILANAIQSTKAKVFLTISGVAYYKPNNKEYTEESVCEPYDFLSELCHAWEKAAKLPAESNIRQVTIRSGVVLGTNGGMIKQIYLPFYFGLGGPIGDGNQYMPWIHVSDLVKLFLFAINKDHVSGILNGVAPEIITNKEFTKTFAAAIRRPAAFQVPSFVLNLLLNAERAKIMLEGQKVKPRRVLELGFPYDYPKIFDACDQLRRRL